MASPTDGFRLHHSMIRVKDPVKSRDFYERILGMRFLAKKDFPGAKFSLYFFSYVPADVQIPEDDEARWEWTFTHRGHCIELTHNWGTEEQADFAYHTGNSEPRGFGHFAISVPDVYEAVSRFEREGVKILKAPDAGTMKGLAFVADPDGYWIEVIKDRARP
eukprot:TRINITY_DN3016_c0_g1_i2.p1 TRINITY_DN3016_c0_g1~~TRINITY_DN3016_c0_g1_i2.p1  ORF type:complete len:177 (-),score=36.93 TRINITY_DN3016_c0_g1_i2:131-616(-)